MILEQTAARQTKLLSLLRQEFGLSAGLVKRLKWQNALFVNGAPAHTDAAVTPGDRVRVVLEERTEGFDPEPLPLSILYEDECFLAVDKSSGMLVHPSPQKNSGTLANGVRFDPIQQDGNSTFEIPVVADEDMAVSALTVAMSEPHLVEYTLHFDGNTLKSQSNILLPVLIAAIVLIAAAAAVILLLRKKKGNPA